MDTNTYLGKHLRNNIAAMQTLLSRLHSVTAKLLDRYEEGRVSEDDYKTYLGVVQGYVNIVHRVDMHSTIDLRLWTIERELERL